MKAELVQIDGTLNKGKYWAIKLIAESKTGRKMTRVGGWIERRELWVTEYL